MSTPAGDLVESGTNGAAAAGGAADGGSSDGVVSTSDGTSGAGDTSIPDEPVDEAKGRLCDEAAAAAVEQANWELVTTGFDEFVVTSSPEGPDPDALGFAGVAFGNDTWVLVGGSLRGSEIHFATASDGVAWEPGSFPSEFGEVGAVSRVFFVKGQFVFHALHDPLADRSVQVLYTSPNGRDWAAHVLPSTVPFVFEIASDGERVVLAAGNLWSSTDFETWSETSFHVQPPLAGIASVGFGSGRWVASGFKGGSRGGVYSEQARLWGSADGVDWEPIAITGTRGFSLAYQDGIWLASNPADENRLSLDGTHFDEITPSGAWSVPAGEIYPVLRSAGGRFVAVVVDRSEVPPSVVRLIASADGLGWHDFGSVPGLALPADAITIEYQVEDIAYDDCRYVAAGSYRVIVPGALDPPLFWSETGPLLLTADLAR